MAVDALTVMHVGPDVRTTGGMATVIGLLCTGSSRDVRLDSAPTWHPGSRTKGLAPTLRLLLRLVRPGRSRPTWLHAHLSEGGSFLREGAVLLVADALGIATAATLHGARFTAYSELHPWIVRRVLGRCRVVFTLGPNAAARVTALCPGTPVRQILNPVDLREVEQAQPPELRSSVLFGGEVGFRKGLDRLVQAWPEVRRQRPDATCLVCGPPGDFPVDDLPEGMTYLGPVSRAELLSLLRGTEVACLPSRDEALPMFVLESLSLGVPVVTTPVGEIGQLGDRQGVALTDGDPAHLAALVVDFLADSDKRAEWGRRGAEWAAENCGVESITRALTSVYRGGVTAA